MYWLYYILIGLAAGWLGGLIVKGGGSGILMNMLIGIAGSVLGGWLFDFLGVAKGGNILWSLLTATAGAVVLLLIVNLLRNLFRKKS